MRNGRWRTGIVAVFAGVTAVVPPVASAAGDVDTGLPARAAPPARPAGADADAVLRYAVPGVALSLDPRTANEFQQIFLEQVYEPLIRTTADGEPAPGLALEWGLVDDGAAFELRLREGVTFQDGEPFDADAVVANLEAATAEGSNLAAELEPVDAVTAVDDLTVRLDLNEPGAHLVGVLAGYAGMMISPAALERDLRSDPVGAGPFVLTGMTDTSVTLERWDGYYEAADVTIAGLEFTTFADETARLRALQSGQLDGAFLGPGQIAEAESNGLVIQSAVQTSVHGLLLNSAHEMLGNDLVRRAIVRAVDRDAIADVLYDGHCHAAVQPYPANYWAHVEGLDDQEAAAFDPDAARELLAEAGVADGFSVTISSNSVTTYQRLAEVVQEQLGQIGIDATVEVSTDVTADQRDGDFDIIVGPFQAGRPDPSIFLEDLYAPDGRRNFGGIEFDEVPELIEASRRSTDVAERASAIGAILERVVAQGPILVPVCIPEVTTALRPGVSGIVISNRQNYDFRHAVVAS